MTYSYRKKLSRVSFRHPLLETGYITPHWMSHSTNIASLKFCQETQVGKTTTKEKEYNSGFGRAKNWLVESLLGKPSRPKPQQIKKSTSYLVSYIQPLIIIPPGHDQSKFDFLCTSMLCTSFLNAIGASDLVNKCI